MPKLLRILVFTGVALTLVNCSRDPQVVKKRYLESGKKYFEKAKYKEATIMFRRALNTDPKYGEAYYELAQTFLKTGQPINAVPALRRAAELLPKFGKEANDANLKLAEILLQAAGYTDVEARRKPLIDEVEEIEKSLLAQDPKSYEGHKLHGDIMLTQAVQAYNKRNITEAKTDLEQSIAEYRLTLAARPDDDIAKLSLARSLSLIGETGEAEQLFRSAIDKNPTAQAPYIELYRIYIGQQKLPEAEAILKKAIAANPKEFSFRTQLAAHYFLNKNKPEGVKVLETIKANFKDFPLAYQAAGDFYLRLNDPEAAIKEYEEGEKKDPANKVNYQKHIIEVLTEQGKTALAYEKNLEILKDNPKDPEARGLKATFMLDKGDINQAINELQAVVTAKPENFVARFQLGRAHYSKNEFEQARQQFEKAIQLRKDYLPPRLGLIQVALARGDYDNAVKSAEEALKISPNSGAAKLLLSAAQMRQGNFKDSRESLEVILKNNPNQPETLLELGVLDLMQKRYPEAESEFRRAYDAAPSNLKGLQGESEAYLLSGKPDEAVRIIQAEVSKYPARNDLKQTLADVQFRTGHMDEAVKTYQELMPLYKDNPKRQGELYAKIGDAYIRKKDNANAISTLRKAHELEPDSTQIINALALLLENSGNHAEARKLYQESITRKADDPEALNNLAYLMAQTGGNLDEALTLATRAKQALPNMYEISDTIGWIYLKKNLPDSAMDMFKEITAKVPQNSTYHYHYAMALMQKGDKLAAQKECQLALNDKPNREEEGQIRELMGRAN